MNDLLDVEIFAAVLVESYLVAFAHGTGTKDSHTDTLGIRKDTLACLPPISSIHQAETFACISNSFDANPCHLGLGLGGHRCHGPIRKVTGDTCHVVQLIVEKFQTQTNPIFHVKLTHPSS